MQEVIYMLICCDFRVVGDNAGEDLYEEPCLTDDMLDNNRLSGNYDL